MDFLTVTVMREAGRERSTIIAAVKLRVFLAAMVAERWALPDLVAKKPRAMAAIARSRVNERSQRVIFCRRPDNIGGSRSACRRGFVDRVDLSHYAGDLTTVFSAHEKTGRSRGYAPIAWAPGGTVLANQARRFCTDNLAEVEASLNAPKPGKCAENPNRSTLLCRVVAMPPQYATLPEIGIQVYKMRMTAARWTSLGHLSVGRHVMIRISSDSKQQVTV